MADTIEERLSGIDVKLAQIREVLALHSTRFSKIEAQLADLARSHAAKLDEILKRLPTAH